VKRRCHLPLRIKAVDCHVLENATRHITKQYELTKAGCFARRSSAHQEPSRQSDPVHSESDAQVPALQDSANLGVIQELKFTDSHDSAQQEPASGDSASQKSASHDSAPEDSALAPPPRDFKSADSERRDTGPDGDSAPRDSKPRDTAFSLAPPIRKASFDSASSCPQLVLRRGQKFTIELAFDRPFDKLRDDIIFTFQFGIYT